MSTGLFTVDPKTALSEGQLVVGQIARHYKGGLYRVNDFVTLEASASTAVVYSTLDPVVKPVKWTRDLEDFFAPVGEGLRFTPHPVLTADSLHKAMVGTGLPRTAVEAVLCRYDEAGRFYHDRQHLFSMFDAAESLGVELTSEQALAILFHDAVYTPGVPKGLNEQLSTNVFQMYFNEYLKNTEVSPELVKAIIKDTVEHKATTEQSGLVLDLDLLNLAGPFEEFKTLWELNRLEYAPLTADKDPGFFDRERLRFLLSLCAQPKLFASQVVLDRGAEQRARNNLEKMRQQWAAANSPAA